MREGGENPEKVKKGWGECDRFEFNSHVGKEEPEKERTKKHKWINK